MLNVSVPMLVAALAAFLATLLCGPEVIRRLTVLKFGQNINTFAPESHTKKQGTPTMGGWLIALGVVVGIILAGLVDKFIGGPGWSWPLIGVVWVFAGHVLIGFIDDYTSIKRGKSLGLKARYKLLLQFVISGIFVVGLALGARPDFTTDVSIGQIYRLGNWYYPIALLLLVGMSNATNLTDGLDGLAGSTSALAAVGLGLTVYSVDAFGPLTWFAFALAGACLGFLWFNAHPAKVFMGDTGSLAIGAALTAIALLGKQEVLLLIFSVVFIVEIVSVMIQVSYFKLTKGKRVFLMTPIHHHFEKLGWPETQVVARFAIIGALALVTGVMLAPHIATFMVGR
jgi:phospho-N-acetylmuramoyl-pentapeptide-transferase